MWFLTPSECEDWCRGRGIGLESTEQRIVHPALDGFCIRLDGEPWSRLHGIGRFLASIVEPFDECLCWTTLWGVWTSAADLHLYYRFREAYSDRRPLHAAPGHLVAGYEKPELISIIQLSLIYGWDFHLLPSTQYATVFCSHDDYVHLYVGDPGTRNQVERQLNESGFRFVLVHDRDHRHSGKSQE